MKNFKYLLLLFTLYISSCNPFNSVDSPNTNQVEIMYNWLQSIQLDSGLLPTHDYKETSISLYDNALAVIAFVADNKFENAEKILDFFQSKLDSEFNKGTGGFAQFRSYETGIAVDDARWMGDNAWLLIAINNYHYYKNNQRYLDMAIAIENWLKGLQDSDGGLFAGYDSAGEKKLYKVIEGNIDAYNAIKGQTDFHSKLLQYLNTNWNPFQDYALDTTPWGYCVLPNISEEALTSAKRFLVTINTSYSNKTITGYCFDTDLDTIWFEGTGEMAVAYNKAQNYTLANYYIGEMEKGIINSPKSPHLYGIPYVADANEGKFTAYSTDKLWIESDKAPHISSTVWYIFAKLQFNPFDVGIFYQQNVN